ncbi:MAG: hypothetical protein Kow0042_00240 [Calditrichia bacterium]
MKFTVDLCQFADLNEKTRLEIYYSILLNQFAPAGETASHFTIQIELSDMNGEVLHQFTDVKQVEIPASPELNEAAYYVDMQPFVLDTGRIQLSMSITDESQTRQGQIREQIEIKHFGTDLSLSDMLFISQIRKEAPKGNLVRHGVLMVPAVKRLFKVREASPYLLVYYEMNNLTFLQDRPTTYSVRYWIADLSGKKVTEHEKLAIPVSGEQASRIEKVPLQNLNSGIYRFYIQITDMESDRHISQWRYFTLVNPLMEEKNLLPMHAEDEKRYYDQLKYIATKEELRLFQSLDKRGKQRFILDFYRKHDSDPTTPENEFLEEHFRRIAYCQTHFQGGIESDMGRIYIQYGPPLDIQRFVSTTEYTKPVEIWTYPVNGTSEFVFVDRNEDGQYVLVHSSHPDEFHNPEWKSELSNY